MGLGEGGQGGPAAWKVIGVASGRHGLSSPFKILPITILLAEDPQRGVILDLLLPLDTPEARRYCGEDQPKGLPGPIDCPGYGTPSFSNIADGSLGAA